MAIVSERCSYSFVRYNPDAAHNWVTAGEKPTATFELMSVCEPHFAALDAKLTEAINTLLNSRNDDLARQLINMKETAVKKEAGRQDVSRGDSSCGQFTNTTKLITNLPCCPR